MIYRWLDKTQSGALDREERNFYEQNRLSHGDYRVPRTQVESARFYERDGEKHPSARIVSWGSNWPIHPRQVEIELIPYGPPSIK